MEIKRFFIVEARHPNIGETVERRVFSAKKEALKYARQLARETFNEIDVISKEGLIACANYDDLRTNGMMFKVKGFYEEEI